MNVDYEQNITVYITTFHNHSKARLQKYNSSYHVCNKCPLGFYFNKIISPTPGYSPPVQFDPTPDSSKSHSKENTNPLLLGRNSYPTALDATENITRPTFNRGKPRTRAS